MILAMTPPENGSVCIYSRLIFHFCDCTKVTILSQCKAGWVLFEFPPQQVYTYNCNSSFHNYIDCNFITKTLRQQ